MLSLVMSHFLLLGGSALALEHATCAAEVVEEADRWWERRDEPGVADVVIAALSAARTREPDCFPLRWQLARFHYWEGSKIGFLSAEHAEKGWREAQEAIRIAPDRVEGHYWAAASAGTWAEQLSVPAAIVMGMPEKFEVPAKRAVSLDSGHDGGGPLRTLGIYYARLPWPFRDLDTAGELLSRALQTNSNNAANVYYVAELAHLEGDELVRDRMLVKLETTGSDDPPRARRYRQLGRLLAGAS